MPVNNLKSDRSSIKLEESTSTIIDPATEGTLKSVAGFNIPAYNYVSRGWTALTFTEVWTFKTGGSSGTTVGTITIVYDDVNMSNIVSVTKT